MKRAGLFVIVFLFLPLISCFYNIDGNNNNNSGNDSITGWEWAGIVSPGDSGQHIDVCHYNGHLFTFNYRGELFHCIYPDFSWTQISIPDDNKVYCFYCDTTQGMLYISTRDECAVYEYKINTREWHSLVPDNNPWFDSTKLLDGELYTNMYNVTVHKNKVFIMTAQGWNNVSISTSYLPAIWCSERDTNWVKSDSGWILEQNQSDQVTDFYSIDDYLWATTFEEGLWRYDGVSWMVMSGTTPEEVHDSSVNGGDTEAIPGFRPRSVVKHNGDIYVGNLAGYVHKLLPGNTWDRVGLYYKDYNTNDTIDFGFPTMSLYSYNGFLIKGTFYLEEFDDLWYNCTPNFKKIDSTYNNGLPGTVYGMTNIGDTLFAALGNDEGLHSGVYFLDLKTRKWYNSY